MTEPEKKIYEKPMIERVVLIPGENVLAVCDTITGSGEWGNDDCQAFIGVGCEGPPTLVNW